MADGNLAEVEAKLVVLARTGRAAQRALKVLDDVVAPDERIVVALNASDASGDIVTNRKMLTSLLQTHAGRGGRTVVVEATAVRNTLLWWRDLSAATESFDAVLANAHPAPPDLDTAVAPQSVVDAISAVPNVTGAAIALSADALATLISDGVDPVSVAAIAVGALEHHLRTGIARTITVVPDASETLLSGCLIMKDEEDNVERCVTSLRRIVDEVVIYDTGSTDRSVELARHLGARVIEGTWNDDFAAARNAARAACRGRWLLGIDLDEVIETAASSFRARLQGERHADVINIALFNLIGTELAPTRQPTAHWSPRLLRRSTAHWKNAIHELPAAVARHKSLRHLHDDQLTLLHRGYLTEVFARRDKAARNHRIAEQRNDIVSPTRRAFEVARANALNNRIDDALASYEIVIAHHDEPHLRRVATEQAATLLLQDGRTDEASVWIERRAEFAAVPGAARLLQARLDLALGRFQAVLDGIESLTDYTDSYSDAGPALVHTLRGTALVGLARNDEAANEFVAALGADPQFPTAWTNLLRNGDTWSDAVERATRYVQPDGLKLLAGHLVSAPSSVAGLVAETLWAMYPGSPIVLAVATRVAPDLEIEAAAQWSTRIRAAGLIESCPLRAIATDETRPEVRRLQAAYLGAELFGDADLDRLRQTFLASVGTA